MQNTNECKGFWNFCTCGRCRAADRQLEKDLNNPAKKKQAMQEAATHFGVDLKPQS